jgi:hypothetical protein
MHAHAYDHETLDINLCLRANAIDPRKKHGPGNIWARVNVCTCNCKLNTLCTYMLIFQNTAIMRVMKRCTRKGKRVMSIDRAGNRAGNIVEVIILKCSAAENVNMEEIKIKTESILNKLALALANKER